jgi:hypothetical protein
VSDVSGLSDEGLLICLTNVHPAFIRLRDVADLASERWAESDPEFKDVRADLMEKAEERARELQDRYFAVKEEILRRMASKETG